VKDSSVAKPEAGETDIKLAPDSVMDPDSVEAETFSRIRIRKKSFRIRNEFEVKLL
jgi:hypothetical protein